MSMHDKFKVGSEYFIKYLEDGEIKEGRFKAVGREYRDGLVSKICFVNYGPVVYIDQVLSAAEIIFEAKESGDDDGDSDGEGEKYKDGNNAQSIELAFARDDLRMFMELLNEFEYKVLRLIRREHIKDSKDE